MNHLKITSDEDGVIDKVLLNGVGVHPFSIKISMDAEGDNKAVMEFTAQIDLDTNIQTEKFNVCVDCKVKLGVL